MPTLKALAPTLREPPFFVTQIIIMALFVALGIAAAKRFRDQAALAPVPRARAA
ncbi:MAG: hypothetical protein ABSD75_24095 [Terriglobales bacterium]